MTPTYRRPVFAREIGDQAFQYECHACYANVGVPCKIEAGPNLPKGSAIHTARVMTWLRDQGYLD